MKWAFVGASNIASEWMVGAVRAVGDEVALTIAQQANFDETITMGRLGLRIGVALLILPDAKKARGKKHRRRPGENHQHPARALAGRLAHGLPLQPPCGAAKRQTIGRDSPSWRVAPLLSRPIQAPLASITRASARPNG